MSAGGGGSNLKSEINITPLVDVVLVLLIIFMVIVPLTQVGHPVTTPPKIDKPPEQQLPPPPDQLIIRLDRSGKYFLNKVEVSPTEFPTKLAEAAKNRSADKPIFFAADGELPYGQVAEFLDLCRNSGATNIGIVFDDLGG
jgi:biopolymer transport protein TolR